MNSKKDGNIALRVNQDTKDKFLKIAESIGKRPSEIIQRFINQIVEKADKEEASKLKNIDSTYAKYKKMLESGELKSYTLEPKNKKNVVEIPTAALREFMKCIVQKMEEKNKDVKTA